MLKSHGDTIKILYNPNDPSEVIVEEKINWILIYGVLFAIVAPTISVMIYKNINKPRKKGTKRSNSYKNIKQE